MPPQSNLISSNRRKITVLAIIVLAVAWFIYSRFITSSEKTAAEQVAEQVAKSENPFRADNPLATVETNPFEKAKKVLNPFEQ